MDHRRERGLKTRSALISAAMDLFSRDGFQSTTIDAIVAQAKVSQRTFFHHFPSKEYVLFDGYADRLGDATARFRSTPLKESLWCALFAASMSVIGAIEEQPDAFLRRAQLYADVDAVKELMLRINEDWIESLAIEVGLRLNLNPEKQVGPRLSAMLTSAANRAALDLWARSQGTTDLRRLAMDALGLIRPAVTHIEQIACLLTKDQHRVC